MIDHSYVKLALTLEDYRKLDLSRPLTDQPLGGSRGAEERRQRDADASEAWRYFDTLELRERTGRGATSDIAGRDRVRAKARRRRNT